MVIFIFLISKFFAILEWIGGVFCYSPSPTTCPGSSIFIEKFMVWSCTNLAGGPLHSTAEIELLRLLSLSFLIFKVGIMVVTTFQTDEKSQEDNAFRPLAQCLIQS